MSICLVMIVRNEAHIIAQTLANVLEHVPLADYCISDTGSTDETPSIIKTFFQQHKIPGRITHDEWVDFGHNRTLSLLHARTYSSSDYILIFDADDLIHGTLDLDETRLTHDAFLLKFEVNHTYHRPILIRRTLAAHFVGVLHEYLELPPNATQAFLDGDYYIEHRSLGNRSKQPDYYLQDALILQRAFSTATLLRPRYCFYCAQSYFDASMFDQAAIWYEKRLFLGGYDQERYYSALRLGYIYQEKNQVALSLDYYLSAMNIDPERIEALVYALDMLIKHKHYYVACTTFDAFRKQTFSIKPDKLFDNKSLYQGYHLFAYSIACYYAKRQSEGFSIATSLLLNQTLPKDLQWLNIQNLSFYAHEIDSLSMDETVCLVSSIVSLAAEDPNNASKGRASLHKIWRRARSLLTNFPLLASVRPNIDARPTSIVTICCLESTDGLSSILNTWTDLCLAQVHVLLASNLTINPSVPSFMCLETIDTNQQESFSVTLTRRAYQIVQEQSDAFFAWFFMTDATIFFRKDAYIGRGIQALEYPTIDKVHFNAQGSPLEQLVMQKIDPSLVPFVCRVSALSQPIPDQRVGWLGHMCYLS